MAKHEDVYGLFTFGRGVTCSALGRGGDTLVVVEDVLFKSLSISLALYLAYIKCLPVPDLPMGKARNSCRNSHAMEGFQFDFRCDVQPSIGPQASTSTPRASKSKRSSARLDLRGTSPKAGSKRKAAPAPALDLTSITSSEPSSSASEASEQHTQSDQEDDDSELEIVRKPVTSGSGSPPGQERHTYTILDSEDESADEQQRHERQKSTPRRTSARDKGKQRVIEPDSEDEEVLFSLTKPSQTPTTTPSKQKDKQPARIALGSPVKAPKPASERPKIVIQDDSDDQDSDCDADSTFREDEHNALFNACLAECAPAAPMPLMVFDLMDLQRGKSSLFFFFAWVCSLWCC